MISTILNQLLLMISILLGEKFAYAYGFGTSPGVLFCLKYLNWCVMCTCDELLIWLQIIEFYAMYYLIDAQKDRTVEEIYYDHNAENVDIRLSKDSTSSEARTF